MSLILWLCVVFPNTCLGNEYTEREATKGKAHYVATNGNDQWTGTLPSPNPSGNDGPFATLQRARDVIRTLKAGGARGQFTVEVRVGVYRLNESFTLGPEDSGTESKPVIFRPYNNEHPVLTGTRSIKNFKIYKGRILKADIKGTAFESVIFRQLFADGKRQILARYPNYDPRDTIGGGFLYVKEQAEEGSKLKFRYLDGAVHNWGNLQDGEIFIYPGPNYWNNIISIAEIDRKQQTITLSGNASYAIKPGNRYFFQNLLEELDSPGEWYFDRREKILYFWPVSEAVNVEVPVLKSIIEIKGNEKGIPEHIHIQGFTITGCEGTALEVSGANNILIAGNTILNAGGHGIDVQGGSKNSVMGNDVYEIGGAGIIISGGDRKTLKPASHRAENNYVHNIGVFRKTSSGIDCKGVGNIVSHNLIHSTPRIGIAFDGNDHVIEYNHVHHVNQETQDSGMIYSCARDWTKRGNIVRFNYVHDSGGYGRNNASEKWSSPFYTWGIYLDDWTSGTTVYGNIVRDTNQGGIFIHGGRDNIVENNVIIHGGEGQMVYSSMGTTAKELSAMFAKIKEMGYTQYPLLSTIKDVEKDATMSGNKFVRNIIYYTSDKSVFYDIHGTLDLATTVSNYNTIFHAGMPLQVPYMKVATKLQWSKWNGSGLDQNSIMADPLFVDVISGDFRLLPGSPALKMGFEPIPIDKFGPYQDPLRASWPIKNRF